MKAPYLHRPWNRIRLQRALCALIIIAIFPLLDQPDNALAQDPAELPSYWQYSTSGRLSHVLPADVNHDGVEEILVVDDNDRIDLVSASGKLIWSYDAPQNVNSIAVVELADSGEPEQGIAVGMPNKLLMLSATGIEKWQSGFEPVGSQSIVPGLNTSAAANGETQQVAIDALPIDIKPIDDGQAGILILLQTGELIRLDAHGDEVWRHSAHLSGDLTSSPQVLVSDLDLDGQDEIVLSVFNPRRFGQLILIDNDQALWDLSLSRSVTDLEEVQFQDNGFPLIAVSTTSGHVQVFDYLRRQHWLRTLNTPATSLAAVRLPDQTVLVVGTNTGSITGFNEQGRRLWTTHIADEAEHSVLDLTAAPHVIDQSKPVLAAILETGDRALADLILVDGLGRVSGKINDAESRNLTQFVDINNDLNNELLVPRFATLELLGMGVGNTGNVQEWEYSLNAAPSSVLVEDLDRDGNDELIIGTSDGRVHSLSNNRAINWLIDSGDAIHDLATFQRLDEVDKSVIVAGNNRIDGGTSAGWVQMREPRGERVWEHALHSPITAMIIADVIQGGDPEIVAGTGNGNIVLLSSQGEQLYEKQVFKADQEIEHIGFMSGEENSPENVVAVNQGSMVVFNGADPEAVIRPIASYPRRVTGLHVVEQYGDTVPDVRLIVATEDGLLHGLDANGRELIHLGWPFSARSEVTAGSPPPESTQLDQAPPQYSLLLGTEEGEFIRLDIVENQPLEYWLFQRLGRITDVHWLDTSADGDPDIAMSGTADGDVTIVEQADTSAPELVTAPLEFTGAIFAVDSLMREVSAAPDLVVIGENGLVRLLRNQENRPPFLTNPVVNADEGQYSISVDVNDIERDAVLVNLELFDSESGEWIAEDPQQLSEGVGTLFWALPSPPFNPNGLDYRFIFSDGSIKGRMVPPPGPTPAAASAGSSIAPYALLGVAITGLILGLAYIRQAQTPNARASRIYQQMHENPTRTLSILEEHIESGDIPDLLPYIASHARQTDDRIVTNLADGLFILAEQPLSALPILNQVLSDIAEMDEGAFDGSARWSSMCDTGQTLLEAPSITELSLLAPRVERVDEQLGSEDDQTNAFSLLIPTLHNLRDSERVDLAEDRLVYLGEAKVSLNQTQKKLPEYAPSLAYLLVRAITRRWSGLVGAEIEDLQGRAELVVTLKTRHLVPSENTAVALEILNSGRAPAEDLVAVLDDNPAFTTHIDRQVIPYLPPGRMRQIRFTITPEVSDRFRISMTVSFSDRNSLNRTIAFGDMVHMLPPVRDFRTIANPYTPGTPLRQDSLLFFGREDLFEFIAENAGQRSYRNVLILVGQRRTGKTSALLRLEDHLPGHLLPVYIDCQSLGVVPGMPALLEEMAWYISDALAKRGIEVKVPDLASWQKDPTRLFQRQFLPYVQSLLPEGSTLLLVFDEFEAFETLVADNILPSTFFTYLRHLMQHSEWLNFIFVGTRRLEEMTSDYWSVLFNIALYRKIGFLDDVAAMKLITEPVAPNLSYDDLALDKIMRVTAGHPYFLQLVCYTLVKQANVERSGYVTISNVNAAVNEMLSLGEVHFAYLWKRSSVAERAILATVAHLMDHTLPFHPEELIQELQPYDIHLDPAEVTAALSSLVERDIMREVTEEAKSLYEMKLGLVSLWVAKNKSLSKLFAGDNARTNGRSRVEPVQDQ